jgi:hypothetical protein
MRAKRKSKWTSSADWGWIVGKQHERLQRKRLDIEQLATDWINLHPPRVAVSDLAAVSDAAWKGALKRASDIKWQRKPKRAGAQSTQSRQWAAARRKLERSRQRRWALRLRELWTRKLDEPAMQSVNRALDGIFAPRRLNGVGPAFALHVGTPVFEPRDLLDVITSVIVKARGRGLLRRCAGSKRKGWDCVLPYLVAKENRQLYCEVCAAKSLAEIRKQCRKNRASKTKRPR